MRKLLQACESAKHRAAEAQKLAQQARECTRLCAWWRVRLHACLRCAEWLHLGSSFCMGVYELACALVCLLSETLQKWTHGRGEGHRDSKVARRDKIEEEREEKADRANMLVRLHVRFSMAASAQDRTSHSSWPDLSEHEAAVREQEEIKQELAQLRQQ
eukprot:6181822-Pleurochrysis_carterae.AAC.3